MQAIETYIRADNIVGKMVDAFNTTTNELPVITRGFRAELKLHLLGIDGDPLSGLENYVAWDFVAADDWDTETPPQIRVIDGISAADGVVTIPLLDTNSEELIRSLGTQDSKKFGCELVGFGAGETAPEFILQFDIMVRNRRSDAGTGTPTPVEDGRLSAAQIYALMAANDQVMYSADGSNWHDAYAEGDLFLRRRSTAVANAEWTVEDLAVGPAGTPGVTYYPYIAYASDDTGAGFSLTPDNALKYQAEIHTSELLEQPTLNDFIAAGAVWVKYIGDGDMKKEEYDSDGNGQVDKADVADEVNWMNVKDKPVDYSPAPHRHSSADLADKSRQIVVSEAAPATFYLNADIIEQTAAAGNTLIIDFPSVKTAPGGEAYAGQPGDVFTCELWVYANTAIAEISIGGAGSTMTGLSGFPAGLELKDGAPTLHVFTIRGRYREGAKNNLSFSVNYAYSEVR